MSSRFSACVLMAVVSHLCLPSSACAQAGDLYDINTYRTIYLSFAQPNWWTQLENNYQSKTEIPATMVVDGVTYNDVGVRFRGNTSYTQLPPGSEKKSFNIRTDFTISGQDILGYDHLNLNNGFHDPTFLREFLTYYVMRQYGPAPGCNFVKLYLNNQFWGVYINVQQPNKDFLRQWWRSDDGNRYRGFPVSGGFQNGRTALTWLGPNVNQYLSAYEAKEGDGTDLLMCCDILNNTPSNQLQATLPDIFSVDQFYRYAAVMNIMLQLDSYISSGKDHYLYHDDLNGQFHMFPFDVNESLGSENGSATTSMWERTTDPNRPCFSKTLVFPDWRARYVAHYRTIAEDSMSWGALGPILNQFHSMIAADVAADTKKIYTTSQFHQNLTTSVTVPGGGGPFGGGSNTIAGLQPLIQGRDAYLATVPELITPNASLANLQHQPLSPLPTQDITFTVAASGPVATVSLWTRSAGPFIKQAMFDDGQNGDGAAGDGIWGLILPAQAPGTLLDYYAEVATSAGVVAYLPKTAEHKPNSFQVAWPTGASPVRINEFLAKNENVIQDPSGEWDDYLELYNTSTSAIMVGGMYVTDNLLNPTKFMIPMGTMIAGHSTLLIWCDEDGMQGPLHANFKLSAGGEDISLFASDGITQLDTITFGAQEDDISTGRLLDGGGPWVTYPVPTPDVRNELSNCGSRIYSGQDYTSNTMSLVVNGVFTLGASASLVTTGGPPSSPAYMVISSQPDHAVIPGTQLALLLSLPNSLVFSLTLDPGGANTQSFTLPIDPALSGVSVYAQVAAIGSTAVEATNAVEVVICP